MKDQTKTVPLDGAVELFKQMLDDGEISYSTASVEEGEHTAVEYGFKHPQDREAFLEALRNDEAVQARLEDVLADGELEKTTATEATEDTF